MVRFLPGRTLISVKFKRTFVVWYIKLYNFRRYYFGDGCEMTRATWQKVEQAGFSEVQLHHIQAPISALIKPHIMGYAVK
ncbi:putative methyltransferase-like protein 7A isoform X1, partial [Tachysurus ichikawai]